MPVEAIHIAEETQGPCVPVTEVNAVAGRGLEGDRIFNELDAPPGRKQVTFIEVEALEGLKRETGIELSAADSRRNIATRNVALNHLVDREFTCGPVRLRGLELCEPCKTLEQLNDQGGLVSGLLHRGGLRAEVLEGGTIRIGDAVTVIEASSR